MTIPITPGPGLSTAQMNANLAALQNAILNATTASFTQPNVGSTVAVTFNNTYAMVPGAACYIQGGGSYTIYAVNSATVAVLTNPGGIGNASPGATVGAAAAVTGPVGGPGGGGGASVSVTANVNLIAGQPIYLDAGSSQIKLGSATATASSYIIGLAGQTVTAANPCLVATGFLSLSNWSAVIGTTSLTPGAQYFLSSTPGQLTLTAPTTTGNCVAFVGTAISTSTLQISPATPILL